MRTITTSLAAMLVLVFAAACDKSGGSTLVNPTPLSTATGSGNLGIQSSLVSVTPTAR